MGSGRRVPMTVTFLEMTSRPVAPPPPTPHGKVAILRSRMPPVHFYRYLYDTIGSPYLWVERRKFSDTKLAATIQNPDNHLFILYTDGTPAGMAELDLRKEKQINISYFGLMPEAIGRGLGYFFLYHTCINAWAHPITRLTINTCTLDHARALPLYQRMGFAPYSRQERFVDVPD